MEEELREIIEKANKMELLEFGEIKRFNDDTLLISGFSVKGDGETNLQETVLILTIKRLVDEYVSVKDK